MALAPPCWPDAVNANLRVRGRMVVDQINGVRIEKLEDAVRAFESNTNAFDVIEFLPHHVFECLDHNEVARANPRIQKTYNIPTDRRLMKPLNRIGSAPSLLFLLLGLLLSGAAPVRAQELKKKRLCLLGTFAGPPSKPPAARTE